MFLSIAHLDDCLQAMTQAAMESCERSCPPFQFEELLQLKELLIYASRFPDTTHEELLGKQREGHAASAHFRTSTDIPGFMTYTRLRQWKRYFRIHTSSSMEETLPNNTDVVLKWLAACTNQWQLKFTSGSVITVDETMWSWSGLCGDVRLTYLPRKPEPLGWMLKTTCCYITGVYILSLIHI